MIPRRIKPGEAQRRVTEWNRRYPAPQRVHYYPVRGDDYSTVHATRGPAEIAYSGIPVLFLEAIAGYVALDHCEPISRCEWNPDTGKPAADGDLWHADATLSVGTGKNNYHLCASCAALPDFHRLRRHRPLGGAHAGV